MIVGAREGDTGQVRLYRSADLRQWQDGVLDEAESTMGYMWECPDFFTLNGKRVLMFSQGMQAEGFSNRNLFQSGYLIGEWQPGQRFIRHGEFREMDHGHDFYAPQSFATRWPADRDWLAGYVGIAAAGAAGRLGSMLA
jgi:beta-fructofuranosidase